LDENVVAAETVNCFKASLDKFIKHKSKWDLLVCLFNGPSTVKVIRARPASVQHLSSTYRPFETGFDVSIGGDSH
jgi:hypothetical protein